MTPNTSTLRRLCQKTLQLLAARGATLSTAESCTGGLIAKAMTDLPGSSAVFSGACVTYTNAVKLELLGVDPAIIERHTEVSAECAAAMAAGVRERLGTTYALSTTGYAGPTGGTARDPIGTVYIGLATPDGVRSVRIKAPAGAGRTGVRLEAACATMELLIKAFDP